MLAEALPDLLRNLPFPKKMRWAREREPFIRPIHWIVALLGDAIIPLQFAGVQSDRETRGHRFYCNHTAVVTCDLDAYVRKLADLKVMVDPDPRRDFIRRGVQALCAEAGGTWIEDEATLETVTFLTEWPAPLLGSFDEAFLEIPARVIQTTLRENQKLFTMLGPDGHLLPRFVAVANTLSEASRATVATGNARVVSARLSDARFFVQEDTRVPLEAYLPKLGDRIYLQGLGTTEHRVGRILALAGAIAADLCPAERERVERAALLQRDAVDVRHEAPRRAEPAHGAVLDAGGVQQPSQAQRQGLRRNRHHARRNLLTANLDEQRSEGHYRTSACDFAFFWFSASIASCLAVSHVSRSSRGHSGSPSL